jgi:2-alkyl-3-oxoalkanoate reductase
MRVFVTGGTGLVGSHVAEQLRAAGERVVALVRPGAATEFLSSVGAELVTGDVRDGAEQLAELVHGCDAVVHAAAGLYGGDPRSFEEVNVGGTERVLLAASLAGTSRALHVSSIAVYGAADRSRPLTEERWREVAIGPAKRYPYTKRRAEELAWSLHGRGLIRLTSVRPGIIYGERDRLATPWLIRATRFPLLPVPYGGRRTVPVVYAGNVARAIVRALREERSVGRAYNLSDGEPITSRYLLETLARELGRRTRVVGVPAVPLRLAARTLDAAFRLLPGREVVSFRTGLERFLGDNPYDSARARQELGWTDLVPHADALARTAAWFRRRGLPGSGDEPEAPGGVAAAAGA